jgi:molecular chaperone DnaK
VEVTFDIDANGILNVTAKDKATGKEQKVTITASTNLNKADIDRMVQESKQHESEDKKRRELIDARNTADNLVYQLEKTLRELGDKVPADERLEHRARSATEAGCPDDPNAIKSATDGAERVPRAEPAAVCPGTATTGGPGPRGSRPVGTARRHGWRCGGRGSQGVVW